LRIIGKIYFFFKRSNVVISKTKIPATIKRPPTTLSIEEPIHQLKPNPENNITKRKRTLTKKAIKPDDATFTVFLVT